MRISVKLLALILSLFPVAAAASAPPFGALELDLTSAEYQKLLATHGVRSFAGDSFDPIMAAGKRNLQWLDAINAARPDGPKLELSTAATQRGYPIDAPTRSNRAIVNKTWTDLTATFPAFIADVLLNDGTFVTELPIADEDFLAMIRRVDRAYQQASRWLLEEPYLDYYGQIATADVRGYYFLHNTADLEATLKAWTTLSAERQTELSGWLVGECVNSEDSTAACKTKLASAIQHDGNPWSFHAAYVDEAQQHWDSYFTIPDHRSDVTWTSADPGSFSIPFRDPGRDDVKAWLRDNIQDEWRWQTADENWQLTLAFKATGSDNAITHVKFVEGATPHVNGIAGNEITMDGNRNIGEYTSRWTIRHEYGHVLGFPDCYLEFYDTAAGEMIQYQLDITNLMCSRTGHLQQRHYDELKRVYYKE